MGVHVLRHLGEVAARVVVIEVRVADNGLLLGDELEVLADFLEILLVRVVPRPLLQQVLGVLVRRHVGEGVQIDFGSAKARPKVIDRLDDLSAHFAHLVERGQVGILRVLVKVQRVIIAVLLRALYQERSRLDFKHTFENSKERQ